MPGVLKAKVGGVWTTIVAPTSVEGTWTPTISSLGTSQPSYGNSDVRANYQRIGMWCDIEYYLAFGSSWNGGTGQIGIATPFPAANQPTVYCKLYIPSVGWDMIGTGYMSGSIIRPLFGPNPSNTNLGGLSNANNTAAAGTGNPQASGVYPMATPGSLILNAKYRIAPGY